MKKNWMKKLSAALCAATLFASGFAVTAYAVDDNPDYDVRIFTPADYATLTGKNNTSGKITVQKFITEQLVPESGDGIYIDGDVPVNNVEFTLVKVGRYANVVDSNAVTSTRIGIVEDFVELVIDDYNGTKSQYAVENGYVYMTADQYNSFNEKMEKKGNQLVDTISGSEWYNKLDPSQKLTETTGDTSKNFDPGEAVYTFNAYDFGIYLVMETDVYNAVSPVTNDKWENTLFAKKQYPYIVSLPYTTQPTKDTDAEWLFEVTAKAKNTETTVNVEKKIERNSNTLTGGIANQTDTDVTHIGDNVEFTLKTDIPMIENHEFVESYIISDEICAGISLPEKFSDAASDDNIDNILVKDSLGHEYVLGTDYNVAKYADITEAPTPGEGYADGFQITFTKYGLEKLTTAAHVTNGNQKVYTSYIATVNSNAVVGTVGNPNKVKLDLRAAGSGTITTNWDEVKEFIFSMEANKTFDGTFNSEKDAEKAASVTFELYLDKNCTHAVVLEEVLDENGVAIPGRYTYVETVNARVTATPIKLDAKSKFSVKGVPVSNEENKTLYLKETTTAPGYNKLTRVVPVTLTANNVTDSPEYDGILYNAYVNERLAEIIEVNGEGVAVSAGEKGSNSGISFTVNNTSGFQLPSTGGMGIWMFVIGGMAVIGCGLLYYRRNKSAE